MFSPAGAPVELRTDEVKAPPALRPRSASSSGLGWPRTGLWVPRAFPGGTHSTGGWRETPKVKCTRGPFWLAGLLCLAHGTLVRKLNRLQTSKN